MPRVRICLFVRVPKTPVPSQAELYPSPTEVVGHHCIQPKPRKGKELHVLLSFVYSQKVLLALLIHCYDLAASKDQRLQIMVSTPPPWLKGMFLTLWINYLFTFEDLDSC